MFDQEMTTIVLNALPEEWGNFTASIWAKKEASSLKDLWATCKVEEARLNIMSCHMVAGNMDQA